MGFPSPATDYVEDRLTVDKLCDVDMELPLYRNQLRMGCNQHIVEA